MKHALALYEHDKVRLAEKQLSHLEKTVIAQVSFFRRSQPETSMKVVLCGLALRRIKASLGHGNWEPWIKRNIDPVFGPSAPRVVRNWMRLADVFVEQTKLSLPDFLALPGDQTELALSAEKDATAKRLMDRLEKFVGDQGPTDLMIKHGVREAEKRTRSLRPAAKDEAEADARHTVSVQDCFNEIDGLLRDARKAAADKAVWMSFSKQQHADLKASAETTASFIADLYVKTHGRNRS